jgi:hypothetical protein
VKKAGHARYTQSGIVLKVNSNPAINVTLAVRSVTQLQAAMMVESCAAAVGQAVNQERVVGLPLKDRLATKVF